MSVSEKVKEKPYAWLLPVLSILAGFAIDFSKRLFPDTNDLTRTLLSAMLTLAYYFVGVIWDVQKEPQKNSALLS